MATTTQHNPNANLNARLNQAGASKTIYALVTPETEATKAVLLGNAIQGGVDPARAAYLEQFRDAWTAKQDALHEAFFDTWHEWSAPLVDLDRGLYRFAYPTAGASEPPILAPISPRSLRWLMLRLRRRGRGGQSADEATAKDPPVQSRMYQMVHLVKPAPLRA